MTENEAVEKCTKALSRHEQQPEHIWREAPESLNFARQMVVCLITTFRCDAKPCPVLEHQPMLGATTGSMGR
jgi:hypothetical protein